MKTAKAGDWWDVSWNPITGCTPTSPGCAHCWAKGLVERFPQLHGFRCGDDDGGEPTTADFSRVMFHPERLAKPLGMAPGKERPLRIFAVDLGDWCHRDVARDWQVQMLAAMALTPWHTFVVCTKRAREQRELLADERTYSEVYGCADDWLMDLPRRQRERLERWLREHPEYRTRWPLPNLWVLATVCNQEEADRNVPEVLQTPAAVRGVHVEPMLGPVDQSPWIATTGRCPSCGPVDRSDEDHCCLTCGRDLDIRYGLDWVICGGENGAGARPMHPAWVRELRDQCQAAGVPFWFKGTGTAHVPKGDFLSRLLDGREWNELPKAGEEWDL